MGKRKLSKKDKKKHTKKSKYQDIAAEVQQLREMFGELLERISLSEKKIDPPTSPKASEPSSSSSESDSSSSAEESGSEYSSGSPSDADTVPEDTKNSYSPQRKKKKPTEKEADSPTKENGTPPTIENTKVKEAVRKNFGPSASQSEELAPPIHEELVGPWREVATKGLPIEERDALIASYPLLENCPFLRPPVLNKEVAKAIGSFQTKRDDRLIRKQKQEVAALSGLAKLMASFITAEDAQGKQHFDTLCAVSRLVLDSFHEENNIRRALICSNLNETAAEALRETVSGEFLFGNDLVDRVKAFKALDQSALEFRQKKSQPKNSQPPPQVKAPIKQAKRGGLPPKSGKVWWNAYPKNRQSRESAKKSTDRPSSTHRSKPKRSLSNRR